MPHREAVVAHTEVTLEGETCTRSLSASSLSSSRFSACRSAVRCSLRCRRLCSVWTSGPLITSIMRHRDLVYTETRREGNRDIDSHFYHGVIYNIKTEQGRHSDWEDLMRKCFWSYKGIQRQSSDLISLFKLFSIWSHFGPCSIFDGMKKICRSFVVE